MPLKYFNATGAIKSCLASLLIIIGATASLPAAGQSATPRLAFGSSTTALPNALLAEVLKRDKLLHKNLAGTAISFTAFEKGTQISKGLKENTIDVAILGDFPALEAASSADVLITALVRQNFATTVGPKGMTLASLKGQRIGTVAGTTGVFALLHGLESVGMTEKDIKVVNLPINELTDALLNGRIEAVALFEPLPSAIIKKYPDRFAALHKQASSAYMVMNRAFAEKNPQAATQISAALARAIRWMRKDKANLALAAQWASKAMTPFTGSEVLLSEQEIARQTRSTLLDLTEAPALPANSTDPYSMLGKEFEFLKRHRKLPEALEWDKVAQSFQQEAMKTILSDAKKYQLDIFDYAK